MNDEIKEILDILKNCKDYDDEVFLIKQHSVTLLLDYITNLQQNYKLIKGQNRISLLEIERLGKENERLKHQLKVQEDLTIKNRMRKHIYKSRCEKAIELINVRYKEQKQYDKRLKDLLNILQNGRV